MLASFAPPSRELRRLTCTSACTSPIDCTQVPVLYRGLVNRRSGIQCSQPAPRFDRIFSRHPTSVSANRAIIPNTLTRKAHDGSHRLHRGRSRRPDRRARDGVARRARRGTLLARPSAVRGVAAAQPNRAQSARSRAALRRTDRLYDDGGGLVERAEAAWARLAIPTSRGS